MVIGAPVFLPAPADPAEAVDNGPIRADENLAAVEPILRPLDQAEADGDGVLFRRGLETPDGLAGQANRHLPVHFIVPAQAAEALQSRLSKDDQIGLPGPPGHDLHHGL